MRYSGRSSSRGTRPGPTTGPPWPRPAASRERCCPPSTAPARRYRTSPASPEAGHCLQPWRRRCPGTGIPAAARAACGHGGRQRSRESTSGAVQIIAVGSLVPDRARQRQEQPGYTRRARCACPYCSVSSASARVRRQWRGAVDPALHDFPGGVVLPGGGKTRLPGRWWRGTAHVGRRMGRPHRDHDGP